MKPHHILDHLGEGVKNLGDLAAASVALGVLVKFLPTLASGLTVLWMLLRIFDWVEARWQGRRLPKD